ncbi:type II secretion system protein M [Nocardioides sp. GY 10113]|uniref:type II secretion system protein GspM n=1 Tax=Nocardioides sp. GY 10113 TaxID=2569761 RepID=UPI0010A755E6|nr:type II secretion system protein GspM [Nocardioides sp. GY 10113]TIC88428.1 type II secretion system protein M [Nocardioides sp. GY 10113]
MSLRTVTGTLVLGIAGILVLLAVSWMLLISPVLANTSTTRDSIESSRTRNQAMAAQLSALQQQERQLPRYQAAADELAALFPPTAAQKEFFAAIVEAARQAGIGADDVTAVSPGAPVPLGPNGEPLADAAKVADTAAAPEIAEQTVTVTAAGTDDQVRQLLANLERMDRTFVVTSLTVDGSSDEPGASTTSTVSVTGSAFVGASLTYEPGANRVP